MRRIRSSLISLAFTAAVAATLAACGHSGSGNGGGIHFDRGGISLKNGSVLIKVKGQDTAHVSGDGHLRIGDKEVAVSPAAQAALARYNADALGFTGQAVGLGLDSADFALHSVGQMFNGLLQGKPEEAGKQVEQGGQAIEAKARVLCQRLQDWRQAQDDAAAAAPEFRPYAVISAHDADDCQVSDHGKPAADKPAAPQQISS